MGEESAVKSPSCFSVGPEFVSHKPARQPTITCNRCSKKFSVFLWLLRAAVQIDSMHTPYLKNSFKKIKLIIFLMNEEVEALLKQNIETNTLMNLLVAENFSTLRRDMSN